MDFPKGLLPRHVPAAGRKDQGSWRVRSSGLLEMQVISEGDGQGSMAACCSPGCTGVAGRRNSCCWSLCALSCCVPSPGTHPVCSSQFTGWMVPFSSFREAEAVPGVGQHVHHQGHSLFSSWSSSSAGIEPATLDCPCLSCHLRDLGARAQPSK